MTKLNILEVLKTKKTRLNFDNYLKLENELKKYSI